MAENNCPLDRDQLGHHTWNLIHSIVAYYPDEPTPQQRADVFQFFTLLGLLYPCQACGRDFTQLITARPPVTDSQTTLSQWLCWIHNQVSKKINKPEFDCSLIDERWKYGWKDGSCDF